MQYSLELEATQSFLRRLIREQAELRTVTWLTQQEEKMYAKFSERSFYLTFGSVPRFVAPQALTLSKEQQQEAHRLRPGWQMNHWGLRHTVRAYLLLLLSELTSSPTDTLTRLLETADVNEQVAIYQPLSLLPPSEGLVAIAINGLRTNISSVFDAIALRNSYPANFFDEAAWNQLVLKAVFMGRPLYLIHGADAQANPTLARILVDFAHERWAAHRPVTPELWRFVAPFLEASHQPDLERVIASDDPWERAAGILAAQQSNVPELQSLSDHQSVASYITAPLTWHRIGQAYVIKKRNE